MVQDKQQKHPAADPLMKALPNMFISHQEKQEDSHEEINSYFRNLLFLHSLEAEAFHP